MATLDPLSDAGRVEAILGRPASNPGRVALLLAAGSAAFRKATRQTITAVAGDVATFDGDGSRVLLLPELPVTTVAAVTVDGVAIDGTSYEWSERGILRRAEGWPDAYRNVSATYDHGYDTVPEDVAYAVAEWVAQRLSRDPGVLSVSLGAFSTSFDRAGVTEAWAATVAAYRHP